MSRALVLALVLAGCGSIQPPNWGGSFQPLTGVDGNPLLNDAGRPIMISVGADPESQVGRALERRQAQAREARADAEWRYWRGRIMRELEDD